MIQIKSGEAHKRIDESTITNTGIPAMVLMERAALEVAMVVMRYAFKHDRICAVVGNGKNGGDGIAAARILYQRGRSCTIVLCGKEEELSEEAGQQLAIAKKLGITVLSKDKWKPKEYTIIIDAIFGIGLNRNIQAPIAGVIKKINEMSAIVISVDIPSGIQPDTGAVLGVAVQATETITFGFYKPGLLLYPGAEYAGKVSLKEIGFDINAAATAKEELQLYSYDDCHDLKLPARKNASNKGTYGKVLLIAGFEDMTGACAMSALACYRSGAGLVRVVASKDSVSILRVLVPEAMASSCDQKSYEQELKQSVEWADVIAIGPGLGKSKKALFAINLVLLCREKQLILDADAINLLADEMNADEDCHELNKRLSWLNRRLPEKTILTPHPMELSRVLSLPLEEINQDRLGLLQILCRETNLVFVCKDARTLTGYQKQAVLNRNGNNGMATGGCGDVLTGIIAAFCAAGMDAFSAAAAGVFLHAQAGDLSAQKRSKHSTIATDLIAELPGLFQEMEMDLAK